jgi:hypothetical protein
VSILLIGTPCIPLLAAWHAPETEPETEPEPLRI